MKPNIIFSILAGLLNVLAFTIYNWQTLEGNAHPNIASWAVWSFMTILNFTSYKSMSKDWVKSILPTISSIQCVLTFFLALFLGRWKQLGWCDVNALIIGIIASLMWWVLKKSDKDNKASTSANLMLQLGITVGFIPTLQSVWSLPQTENALCWFVWSISFLFQTIVVILRWKGQKQDLVYPVNCLWLHFIVALLALR